jgi:hypothetical protein
MRPLLPLLLLAFILSSCEKYRTDYLSADQKEIIEAFTVGDTFTMLKNKTDTLEFLVTRADYESYSNGKWYENFGPHTWTERGRVLFETTNRTIKENGSIRVEGDATNSISISIGTQIHTSSYQKIGEIFIENSIFDNVFLSTCCTSSETLRDSSYYSVENGIIKIWNNELTYLRLN